MLNAPARVLKISGTAAQKVRAVVSKRPVFTFRRIKGFLHLLRRHDLQVIERDPDFLKAVHNVGDGTASDVIPSLCGEIANAFLAQLKSRRLYRNGHAVNLECVRHLFWEAHAVGPEFALSSLVNKGATTENLKTGNGRIYNDSTVYSCANVPLFRRNGYCCSEGTIPSVRDSGYRFH